MRDGHRGGPGGGDVSPTIRRRESSREIRERARELRREATPSEERLWQALRDRRFRGLKFRRQRPAASFIPDFYCAELSLVVEVDGSIHEEPGVHARDLLRDEWLGRRRLRVLRLPAALVMRDLTGALRLLGEVVDRIKAKAPTGAGCGSALTPVPSPVVTGEGGTGGA